MHKLSIFRVLLIGFVLQSCSYSSPKEAAESAVLGKNYSQKTDAITSRRAPEGNKDQGAEQYQQDDVKRASSSYDAYQHYQSENPSSKAKRRPILNLKELNDLMDREATITLIEKEEHGVRNHQIDANSSLQEVIKYNKKHKIKHKKVKTKKKKRVKVLVVKKKNGSTKNTDVIKNKHYKQKVAHVPAQVNGAAPITQPTDEKVVNEVSSSDKAMMVPPVMDKAPVVPIVPPVVPPVAPVVPPVAPTAPVKSEINLPVVPAAVTKETIQPPVAPIATPEVVENKPPVVTATTPASPAKEVTEIKPPVVPIDPSKMTQQELEKKLKEKFDNKQIGADQSAPLSEVNKGSSSNSSDPPLPSVPLPAIPNATESNMDTALSRLNNILISCYFKVKHSLMSLISSWFGFEW